MDITRGVINTAGPPQGKSMEDEEQEEGGGLGVPAVVVEEPLAEGERAPIALAAEAGKKKKAGKSGKEPEEAPKEWNWRVCEAVAAVGAGLAACERKQHQSTAELEAWAIEAYKGKCTKLDQKGKWKAYSCDAAFTTCPSFVLTPDMSHKLRMKESPLVLSRFKKYMTEVVKDVVPLFGQ